MIAQYLINGVHYGIAVVDIHGSVTHMDEKLKTRFPEDSISSHVFDMVNNTPPHFYTEWDYNVNTVTLFIHPTDEEQCLFIINNIVQDLEIIEDIEQSVHTNDRDIDLIREIVIDEHPLHKLTVFDNAMREYYKITNIKYGKSNEYPYE